MSKTRDTGYLANVIQVHDTGVRIMSGSTMLMAISSSGAVTITGEMSGSDAANALLLDGTGSLAFTTTASYNAFSASYAIASASLSSRTTQVERTYATTGSNTFTGAQFVSDTSNGIGFTSTASFYTDGGLRVGKNAYVSGTAYFNNIVVFGTSSIQYITSSQVNIGANIITVNTDTPAVRFGGLSVFDSGSTQLTGSMLWDSEKNHWVYSNPSGSSYSGGMFISGPRSSALGSEQGTTACMLLVGQGSDHLTSSLIYHDSTRTCFYGNSFISSSGVAYFSSQVCAPSVVTNTVSTGGTALTPTAACLGYGIFGYSGVGLGIASSANGPNQGIGFFVCGDIERMRIITSGNVGIGTLCPSHLLDVNGTIRATGAATFASSITATTLALGSVTPSSNGIYLNVATANGANYGYIRTNCLTVNTTQLILGSTYGYNTPVDALTLFNGSATFASSVTVCGLLNVGGASGTYSVIQRPTAPAGSQGIILTAGAGKSEGGSGITFSDNSSSGGTVWLSGNSSDIYGGGVNLIAYGQTAAANIISFATRSGNGTTTERAQITSGGNLIVGNPAYAGTTTDLSITGDKVNSNGYYSRLIFQNSNQSGGSSASIRGERTTSNFATELTFYTNVASSAGSGVERMKITSGGQVQIKQAADTHNDGFTLTNTLGNSWNFVNGGDNNLYFGLAGTSRGVFATNGVYTAVSDINKKKDFEDSTIGLNAILGLKPTLFRMKDEDESVEKQLGFIAQEVKNYIPQAYVESDGGIGNKFIGLNDRPIVAALVKAIQEQQCKIALLESCLGIA